MSQDKTADLLSALKNAYQVGKRRMTFPLSKLNYNLIELLVEQGYVAGVEKAEREAGFGEQMVIALNRRRHVTGGEKRIIRRIKRISKPGVRIYAGVDDLREHNLRLGCVIVSTPQGLMTSEEAVEKNIGGEVICRVW